MRRTEPTTRDLSPYIRRVYAYVAYRLGDGADAEDITSATFERALRYGGSFDGRRGHLGAWLIGIARREIVEYFADRRTNAELCDGVAPGDLAVESANRIDVRDAVGTLEPRDRELIALRYGADLTAKQIAEILDMKTNAVEVALHRALARLRDRLEEKPAPEPSAEPKISPAPL